MTRKELIETTVQVMSDKRPSFDIDRYRSSLSQKKKSYLKYELERVINLPEIKNINFVWN